MTTLPRTGPFSIWGKTITAGGFTIGILVTKTGTPDRLRVDWSISRLPHVCESGTTWIDLDNFTLGWQSPVMFPVPGLPPGQHLAFQLSG
jgi:hypothetical protein